MPKTFDKVWHKSFISRLKQNGISDNLLSALTDFLSSVPQGSILDPLLFLIYINDLSQGLTINARLFADVISLFSVVDNINFSATNLNSDLSKIDAWANQWKMTFNPDPKK